MLWPWIAKTGNWLSWLHEPPTRSKVVSALLWGLLITGVPAAIWTLIYVPVKQAEQIPTEVIVEDNRTSMRFEPLALSRFQQENEARRTMAQIVLGVFGLLALFVAWRRVRAAEKTVEVAEDGQRTERFTKAIEQLGSIDEQKQPRIEIRLGGIYALQRLARDSERDHWTIMEVLTAYVRENAPYPPREDSVQPPSSDDAQSASKSSAPRKPRTDIQAILSVLKRRERSYEERNGFLDLTQTDLSWADLEEAHLEKADLSGADLSHARLSRANLSGANLRGACLTQADLFRADLRGADLSGAALRGADLWEADYSEADLSGALSVEYEQINQAHGNEMTVLPEGLERPSRWRGKRQYLG